MTDGDRGDGIEIVGASIWETRRNRSGRGGVRPDSYSFVYAEFFSGQCSALHGPP